MTLNFGATDTSRAAAQVHHDDDPGWCDCGAPLDIFRVCCVCDEPAGHEGDER